LLKPFVNCLPAIELRTKGTKTFVIPDSIEGWADSLGVLMSSYFTESQPFPEYAGYEIKFDYSLIRPKGAMISGGFKAPGPAGLQSSLETIEKLLESYLRVGGNKISPILAFDIICHASDAVLSGGVRRSALSMIVDPLDTEMIRAKTGNWRAEQPQRARSNNSVLIPRYHDDKDYFKKIVDLNEGDNDIGFVFSNTWFDVFNPCFEIGFTPVNTNECLNVEYDELEEWTRKNVNLFGVQACNLNEINAEKCQTEEQFLKACKDAAILGTLQAGYTNFPYLGKNTEDLVKREALLGVSITGWMNNPKLFNAELLQKGAAVVVETNKELAAKIEINQAARTTCVKPSGNACTKFDTIIKTNKGNLTLLEIFKFCLDKPDFDIESIIHLTDVALKVEKVLQVYDKDNNLQDIEYLYVNGSEETYDIEFEDGEIYSFTANHKLMTSQGWKLVKDLTENDEIISF
jgi:ribonucleoside-diphosphate reductase alpha chain